MKNIFLIIIFLALVVSAYAYAQSTATPIQLGYLTNSGNWLPYTAANPLPTESH